MGVLEARPYEGLFERACARAPARLGTMTDYAWSADPKRFAFTAARYLTTARLLVGRQRVLEVGCGDGFFSRIVAQHVGQLTAIDRDAAFIEDAKSRANADWPIHFIHKDMMDGEMMHHYDGIYLLDVIEHIDPREEVSFLRNAVISLANHGVMVVGTPSADSQHLASVLSRKEHIYFSAGEDLRAVMLGFFHSVFVFGMNDAVLHGDLGMAHYLLAICADPRTCSPISTAV